MPPRSRPPWAAWWSRSTSNDEKLAAIAGQGAALTLNAQADDAARPQDGDPGLRQGARAATDRVDHFRMLRHPRRPGDGVQPAQSRRDARRRRLHHGQGRDAALEPDGLSRARDRQLGMSARALSGGLGTGAERPRQSHAVRREAPAQRNQPSVRSSSFRRAQAARRSRSRAVEEHRNDRRSRPRRHRRAKFGSQGPQSCRRACARDDFQGRALRKAFGEGHRRQAGGRAVQCLDHPRQPRANSTPTRPTW